jgi:hypothetical protein
MNKKKPEKPEYTTTRFCSTKLTIAMIVLIWATVSPAQLGMGENTGVAQQRLKPRLVHISGKLVEIKTHPCESTTGPAELGTHLIIKDENEKELNIHLGPAPALSETVKQLKVGKSLEIIGFNTDKMPANQYVAKTLILSNRIIELRDSDLRPYWSRSRFGDWNRERSKTTFPGQQIRWRRGGFYHCPGVWRSRFSRGLGRSRPRWDRSGRFPRCR